MRKVYSVKKGDFVCFEDGEVRCLRCGGEFILKTDINLPKFLFSWDTDCLEEKPYCARQRSFYSTLICRNCDRRPYVEHHANILFVEQENKQNNNVHLLQKMS